MDTYGSALEVAIGFGVCHTAKETFLAELVLPGIKSSVPLIRRYVSLALDLAGHQYSDDVQLVLTELAGNAVVHTRSGAPGGLITVELSEISKGLARIEVTDEGAATVPNFGVSKHDGSSGRGLQLVDQLSARWGVRPGSIGHTVWAEVITLNDATAERRKTSVQQKP
jgi:anti-sigma regulatory factor (Ser/Thr protein kinase)